MIGGIEAVVWTDAIQVIVLLGGAIFAVIYISCSLPGGLGETIDIAVANGKFDLGATNFDLKDATMWTVIIAACFTHLTTYGTDQSMVQRYLTTSSMKEARKSVWTNAILTVPATLIFFFIGTALYAYYKVYPENLSISIPNGDAIFRGIFYPITGRYCRVVDFGHLRCGNVHFERQYEFGSHSLYSRHLFTFLS